VATNVLADDKKVQAKVTKKLAKQQVCCFMVISVIQYCQLLLIIHFHTSYLVYVYIFLSRCHKEWRLQSK